MDEDYDLYGDLEDFSLNELVKKVNLQIIVKRKEYRQIIGKTNCRQTMQM